MTVVVTVLDGRGRGESVALPDDVWLAVVADHRIACRERRELVDRRVDQTARMADTGGHRRTLAADFSPSLDDTGDSRDGDGGSTPAAPTRDEETTPMTYPEAAEALRVSPRTIRRMVERGDLVRVGAGRGARITATSVAAYTEGARP